MTDDVNFWASLAKLSFANEGEVETRLVYPMLLSLGYADQEIKPKYPVVFREGKRGRKNEADFAVFAGGLCDRDHSLLVVEAKSPSEKLSGGKHQAETYAANLRVPLYILTNGRRIEVWQLQMAGECNLVFEAEASAMAGRHGELELLASRATTQMYAEGLRRKLLSDVSRDIRPYIEAELDRTKAYAAAIDRILYPLGGDGSQSIMSDRLVSAVDGTAVIIGPSGYGKTTLAMSLLRQCLDAPEGGLTIEMNLSEVAIAGKSLIEFAQARIASHCPQIGPGAFQHLLRTDGALMLFDGFDRLDAGVRDEMLVQIKTLRRDYPATRVIVFARNGVRPDLEGPVYELKEYSESERRAYIEAMVAPKALHPSLPGQLASETLRSLFDIPLLFHLAITYFLERGAFSTNLDALFRAWLESLLQSAKLKPARRIQAESALRLFARVSDHGAMLASALPKALQENGFDSNILDDLIQCDVLRLEGASVELVHEALGEYLRACDVAESDPNALEMTIAALPLATDTMFPVLLASMLKQRSVLNALLGRLAGFDLPVYFEALRYRADNGAALAGSREQFAAAYLEDMLNGFEQPGKAFFGQVFELVTESEAGAPATALEVIGHGTPDWINYSYSPAGSGPRVVVGPVQDQYRLRGSNLRLLGLRRDSGRLLGASQLREELEKLPKERRLHGGVEWVSERLAGALRFLARDAKLPLNLADSLADLDAALKPYAGKKHSRGYIGTKPIFVDRLREDIRMLRDHGRSHLDIWWKKYGGADDDLLADEGNTRGLFNDYYRRVQLVYKELVEHNLASVSHMLGFYTSMPVRWDVVVPPKRDAFRQAWMQYHWRPVAKWDDAGADLAIVPSAPQRFVRFELTQMQEQLRQVGRLTKYSHVWAGSGITPRFDGYSRVGGFTGETPVLEEACDYISDDIKRLFEACPRGDIPYFEVDRTSPLDISSDPE